MLQPEWELFEKGGSFLGILDDGSKKDRWEDGTRIRASRGKLPKEQKDWTAGWSDEESNSDRNTGLSAHTYPEPSLPGHSLSGFSSDRVSGPRTDSDEDALLGVEAVWDDGTRGQKTRCVPSPWLAHPCWHHSPVIPRSSARSAGKISES